MIPLEKLRVSQRGFSLTDLLVSIGIVAVLAALLFSVMQSVVARSRITHCLQNLRQISVASAAYSADNRGEWPVNGIGSGIFITSVIPYLGELPSRPSPEFMKSPLICPTSRVEAIDGMYMYRGIYTLTVSVKGVSKAYGLSYAQNAYATTAPSVYGLPRRSSPQEPGQTMLYMDFASHYLASSTLMDDASLGKRHGGQVNVAYVDGSVRTIPLEEVPRLATQTPNRFWQGYGRP